MNSHSLFRIGRLYSTRGLLSWLAVTMGTAYAQPAHVQLPAPAHGSAAIAALGAHLPDVAKAYGLRSQELVTLFQTQPSMGVDTEGALLFACEGLSVAAHGHSAAAHGKLAKNAEDAMTASTSQTLLAGGTAVDAFKLHSLPGVNRVIYLDFDGHTTTGTSWNSSYTGGNAIDSAPFDLDGDPSTFNADERGMIQRIWQRVAEDYAPFAMDVTTEDPGVDALRRSTSSDTTYGIRVVISPTNWYKSSAGGVAYVGSFNLSTDTPCFAFTGQLGNSEKYIADAVAHEAGHTVGLFHDGATGTSATEYYQGHGDWVPIMGVTYYRGITQFSRGEYANANNTQDDFAVIATYAPLAGDDHGNTTSTASLLVGPNVSDGGTIETRADLDVFRIDAEAGLLSLTFNGPPGSPNLDIKAELLSSSGSVLQSSNPDGLVSSLSAWLNAGTYYIRVSGVGAGDPLSTGYSSYGSVGNYLVSGSFAAGTSKQAPQAVITASATSGVAPLTVSFSGQNSTDADGSIVSYQWGFANGSTAVGVTGSTSFTNPGTYSVLLTVTDNDGLSTTGSVTINVTAQTNVAPVAIVSASPLSGISPLSVSFSSAGSYDPDGSIVGYYWSFGDGTSSSEASPTKVYTALGNYTARLTVTDNLGGTASATVDVSVLGDSNSAVDVQQFTLSATKAKSGTTVKAGVIVRDRLGRPVAGASVVVQWSGPISGSTTGVTDANGAVDLVSARTKKSGTVTATIKSVTPPAGVIYDGSIYGAGLVQTISL